MMNDSQAAASCCGTSAPNPAAAGNGRGNLLGSQTDDLTTCPVMAGSPVSKTAAEAAGLYRDYEGVRFYFCCAGCGPAFDADPARYATSMA